MVSAPKSTLEQWPDHVKAIGMITIEIGNLEIELGTLLAALLHIYKEIGQIIYLTPRAAIARVAVIENIAKATLVEKSEALMLILSHVERARAVIGKRHDMVHEAWGVHKDRAEVHRMAMPTKESTLSKPVPIKQLTDLIEDIRELAQDVRQTADDAFKAWSPYTWPDKRPSPNTLETSDQNPSQTHTTPKRKDLP
jgi:hypothetical protein